MADKPIPPRMHRKASRIRTCFIAAAAKTDLSVLKQLLRERGIRPIVASEFPGPSISVVDHVEKALDAADFMIAVLDQPASSANVYFEVGLAYAQRKPLLVLVAPQARNLPSDVADLFHVRAQPTDREAIAFALDQVLAAKPQAARPSRAAIQQSKPLGDAADSLLKALHNVTPQTSERRFRDLVVKALQDSRVGTVARSAHPDTAPDLAVWSDELSPWVGNPLLIEIMGRVALEGSPTSYYARLAKYLEHSNAQWALLIAPTQAADYYRQFAAQFPTILFIELEELFQNLRKRSFGDIIRDLRNRKVHGATS
jgi:hypothetical protein